MQLAIKSPVKFLPHRTSVCALPGENETSKILHFYSMQHDYLITTTHILSKILALWLSVHPTVQLLMVNIRNISRLCTRSSLTDGSVVMFCSGHQPVTFLVH